MKREEVFRNNVFLFMENHDPIQKVDVETDKVFTLVKNMVKMIFRVIIKSFTFLDLEKKKTKDKKVWASIMIPWDAIASIDHFPGTEGFDFLSFLDQFIVFK